MKGIGGNITAVIQTYAVTKNEIGEQHKEWVTAQTLKGWLDLQSGNANYTTFNAKLQESTHIFLCDYVPLVEGIQVENSRMTINGKRYDILLIDDPMEMHQQLEIYLKFTGGQ